MDVISTPDTFYTVCRDLGRIRISGLAAKAFISAMTTVDLQHLVDVGAVAPALILTGDAEVIDLIMIVRTGDQEYMLTTSPSVRDELFAWLEAHAALSDECGRVFVDLELTDETESLVTVALYGSHAWQILDELSTQPLDVVEDSKQAALLMIGGLPALVLSYPLLPNGYYELSVPPSRVQGVEHFFLSFPEVDPLSFEEFRAQRLAAHTWFSGAEAPAYQRPDTPQLTALLRKPHDFVGGRALRDRIKDSVYEEDEHE